MLDGRTLGLELELHVMEHRKDSTNVQQSDPH